MALKTFSDGAVLFTEQTKCPSCGNELGNVVLERSASHQHHACGKCFKHYIVESKFLAPFSPEAEQTPTEVEKSSHNIIRDAMKEIALCLKDFMFVWNAEEGYVGIAQLQDRIDVVIAKLNE